MSGRANPLQLAAQLKKINECRDRLTFISQKVWNQILAGDNPSFDELNLLAKELDLLSPGEGSRVVATIAVNSYVLLRRKFEDIKAEFFDIRSRLSKIESKYAESIVRSTESSGEDTTK